jgi:class 3 adenylate cyclase/tetratricopeptide (TPR) repeat protein
MAEPGPTGDRNNPHNAGRQDLRAVSVVFADLVGSTQMLAGLDPEEGQERLLPRLALMKGQIAAFNGTLCQTMGDGILAIFGAPLAAEDHAIRAFMAADAMVQAARRAGIELRVGITSGEIFWDESAISSNERPPAIGFAVNLAAKLQNQAAANGIVASGTAVSLASKWLDVEPDRPFVVTATRTAAGEVISTFRVLGIRRRPRRLDEAEPLVGRADLQSRLNQVLDGGLTGGGLTSGGIHCLVGPAGIGKSRLARATAEQARSRGWRVAEWDIHNVAAAGSTSSLAGLVEGLLNGPLPDTLAASRELLTSLGLTSLQAGALCNFVLDQTLLGERPEGESSVELAADGIVRLATAMHSRQPLMILIEDLHFARSDERLVTARLAEAVTKAGAEVAAGLILLTSRVEPEYGMLAGVPSQIHRLTPLGQDESVAILRQILGHGSDLDELTAELAGRCQGNPLFLRELARTLPQDLAQGLAQGLAQNLAPHVGTGSTGGPVKDSLDRLPVTIKGVLGQRLDSLPAGDRQAVLNAAVIGHTFDVDLLSGLLNEDREATVALLRRLEQGGLVNETRLLPRQEFTFSHVLMHQVSYWRSTRKARRLTHCRLVDLLQMDRYSGLGHRQASLARHAALAERWPLVITHGLPAGQHAVLYGRIADGIELLTLVSQAVEKTPGTISGDDHWQLLMMMGRANLSRGVHEQPLSAFEKASDLASAIGAKGRTLEAMIMMASACLQDGKINDAITTGERAVEYSKSISTDGCESPDALRMLVFGYLEAGRYEDAIVGFERLNILLAQGVKAGFSLMGHEALVLLLRGTCETEMGNFSVGRVFLERAVALIDMSENRFARSMFRAISANCAFLRRNFECAVAMAQEALVLMREVGSQLTEAFAEAILGTSLVFLGKKNTGIKFIESSMIKMKRNDTSPFESRIYFLHSISMIAIGNFQEAMELANSAVYCANKSGQLGVMRFSLLLQQICSSANNENGLSETQLLGELATGRGFLKSLNFLPLISGDQAAESRDTDFLRSVAA